MQITRRYNGYTIFFENTREFQRFVKRIFKAAFLCNGIIYTPTNVYLVFTPPATENALVIITLCPRKLLAFISIINEYVIMDSNIIISIKQRKHLVEDLEKIILKL